MGIADRTPFKKPTSIPEYVVIFEGKIKSMSEEHEYETDDVGFFDIDNLPLISKKTSKEELLRFIKAAQNNETFFD